MKKKLLVALLSLAMALSFTMVPAFAVEKPTVTVETAAGAVEVGAKVVLRVSIKDNPGFTNFEWNIRYDKARLELKAIDSELDIVGNPNHSQTGFGYATCARASSYAKDTDLFTLTFTVKADAAAGNAEVTIESDNFKDNRKAIDADYVAGGVTVNGTTGGTGSTTGGTGSTTGGTGSTTGGTGSTGGGSTGGGSSSGSSYTSGMSFTTDLPADSITRVTVNGKKLDSKYYTVSSNGSGSIVTLTDAYLATLKAGTYTIKIESATHVSTGTFTIKADGTPKTADAGIALYAVMAVSSLMGTAVVSKKCRKA